MVSPYPIAELRSEAWILDRVDVEDGCWIWNRYKNNLGYGRTTVGGQSVYAHVLSYVIFNGTIPSELELDHLCRNASCANPNHLEAVTHEENMRRAPSLGKGKCRVICKKCRRPMLGDNQRLFTNNRDGSQFARCRACLLEYDRVYNANRR